MKKILKQGILLGAALAALTLGAAAVELDGLRYYDDRLDVSGKTVEIIDAGTPTSYQVRDSAEGDMEPDAAVLTLAEDTLIAVGTGTAKVRIDGEAYTVTVQAAPISLIMITGHSMGAGQSGSKDQSVAGVEGQVYSSHGTGNLSAATAGVGIGYGARTKANNINAFTEAGEGTIGEGSAFAHEWNRLTGEKVWVLNTAVGGSHLKEWIPGTKNYTNAVTQYQRAQEILSNEISAGHYTLSNMGVFYHNGANFSYKGVTFTQKDLKAWYDSMWNGFKNEFLKDMDGDGTEESVSFLGIIPIWTKSGGLSYSQDEPAGMFMAASAEYENVFTASLIGKDWLTDEDAAKNFPEITYKTQDGKELKRSEKVSEVFASDNVHYKQAAYNAVGMDIAKNLYAYLDEENELSEIKLLYPEDLSEVADHTELVYGEEYMIVPAAEPITCSGLDFSAEGCVEISFPLAIRATGNGTGKLVVSHAGKTVKELTFHCSTAPEFLSLHYDDHLDVNGKTVEIFDAGMPTSYQVGYGVEKNTLPDTAVVTLSGDTLIATGIGDARVRIDGVEYNVEVSAAPLSVFLLTGQSNMNGSDGNKGQSVANRNGQAYSTYTANSALTVDTAAYYVPSALTGSYCTVNAAGTTEYLSSYPVNSIVESGGGKIGMDGAIAYRWNEMTGDKVWTINVAHGGTAISTWMPGKANYNEAIATYAAVKDTLEAEIAAGHYVLKEFGYFWCQGCADTSRTAEQYVKDYLVMHEAFKDAVSVDHDADPATEELPLQFGAIIPIRSGRDYQSMYREGEYPDTYTGNYYSSYLDLQMSGPRTAQIWMGNNSELEDIFNVSLVSSRWVYMPDGTNGVADYFAEKYPDGRVDYPVQTKQSDSWYAPTKPEQMHDSIHYRQIGYNEVGLDSAENLAYILGRAEAPEEEKQVKLYSWDGITEVTEVTASLMGESQTLVVPVCVPLYRSKEIRISLTEGLNHHYYDLIADSIVTTGTMHVTGAAHEVAVKGGSLSDYRWEFDGNTIVSVGEEENTVTMLAGTVSNGVIQSGRWKFSEPIMLLHGQPWVVEWKCAGNWSGMLLSSSGTGYVDGMDYLFRSGTSSKLIAFGESDGKSYYNYGVPLTGHNIDVAAEHVYRIENHIAADGSNMAWLLVDGEVLGVLNNFYRGGTDDQKMTVDFVNGRDFLFGYIGSTSNPMTNLTLDYMAVWEQGTEGETNSHHFEPVVTAPTCTEQGYTTHTCTVCGENYKDGFVSAVGHTYDGDRDAFCNVCGEKRAVAVQISGHVKAESAKVTLQGVGETAVQNGDFAFSAVMQGNYDLTVKREGCLTYTVKGIAVGTDDITLPEIELIAGDINGDDRINIMDVGAFRTDFGNAEEEIVDPLTDVNNDGMVNIIDMGIFRRNFGKTAEKDCTVAWK